MPYPKGFDDRPDESPDWSWMLEAFFVLSPSRCQTFGGAGYIPLSEIESYIRLFGAPDINQFVAVIQHLDKLFLEYIESTKPKK